MIVEAACRTLSGADTSIAHSPPSFRVDFGSIFAHKRPSKVLGTFRRLRGGEGPTVGEESALSGRVWQHLGSFEEVRHFGS